MRSWARGGGVWMALVGAILLVGCEDAASGADTSSPEDTTQADSAEGQDTAEADSAESGDGVEGDGADTAGPDGSGELECALPQAPRDISAAGGTNEGMVPGPASDALWLCNVHFHDPLEHAGVGACPEVTVSGDPVCGPEGEDTEEQPVEAGHVIEVHWVYSSCQGADAPTPAPGQGLAACVCEGGQVLRVRAQVYVVDDGAGLDSVEGPPTEVGLVTYAGSTTGSKWDGACSDVGVNWEVGTGCLPLRREALGAWCEGNAFGEHHGHEPRELITEPALLAPYSPLLPD